MQATQSRERIGYRKFRQTRTIPIMIGKPFLLAKKSDRLSAHLLNFLFMIASYRIVFTMNMGLMSRFQQVDPLSAQNTAENEPEGVPVLSPG